MGLSCECPREQLLGLPVPEYSCRSQLCFVPCPLAQVLGCRNWKLSGLEGLEPGLPAEAMLSCFLSSLAMAH